MIGRIVISEVNRANRQKAARARAAQARAVQAMQARQQYAPPPAPPRPAAPSQPAKPMTGWQIIGMLACLALVIGPWVYLKTQSDDRTDATIANEDTCSAVTQWAPTYDPALNLDVPQQIPDPQLAGDVQRLLNDIQGARVASMAVVPDAQIRADLAAVNGRCTQLALNPGGNNSAAIP